MKVLRAWVALAVAAVVLVASGIAVVVLTRERVPAGANVLPGRQNLVTSSDGQVTVEVPGDAVDAPGTLTITPVDGGPTAWDIGMEGANLVGEAIIRFKVDTSNPDAPTPTVFYQEDQQTPQIAEDVVRGDGEVIVHTAHFSAWWVKKWEGLKHSIVDTISRSVSISEDRAPTCEGEAEARERHDIRSDDGRRVYWCIGIEDGRTVLKAVNGRRYGVAVESTHGLDVTHLGNADVVGQLAKLLTPAPSRSSNTVNLLPSGNQIEFQVTGDEPRAGAVFKPDPGAYLLSALEFGVETYSMILRDLKQGDVEERLYVALTGAACLNDLTGMMTTGLGTSEQAREFFGKALEASFSCVADVIDDMDLGWIVEGLVGPIVWLTSGVKTAIMGAVAAGDIMLDTDGYQIILSDKTSTEATSPTETTPTSGTFNGHHYVVAAPGTVETFTEADAYCQEMGGYLANIGTEAENSFLYSLTAGAGWESTYFGLTDSAQEGTWQWVNGTSDYTNWHSGEPNAESDTEDYAEFYWKYTDGKWNDGNFGNGTVADETAFLCEVDG